MALQVFSIGRILDSLCVLYFTSLMPFSDHTSNLVSIQIRLKRFLKDIAPSLGTY